MSDNTITLADGTVIDMQTGEQQQHDGVAPGYVAVPTNEEAQREVTRVRRRLADLPDVPEKLNAVSVVAAYYLFGLDDWEIAHAMKCTEHQIANIKMTAPFNDLIDAMRQNIIDGEASDVRTMLSQNAHRAAQTMLNELASPSGQNRIVAAKDVMDRAGFRPADVVEHKHRIDGGLTIEFVKKGGDDALPTIDITPESLT